MICASAVCQPQPLPVTVTVQGSKEGNSEWDKRLGEWFIIVRVFQSGNAYATVSFFLVFQQRREKEKFTLDLVTHNWSCSAATSRGPVRLFPCRERIGRPREGVYIRFQGKFWRDGSEHDLESSLFIFVFQKRRPPPLLLSTSQPVTSFTFSFVPNLSPLLGCCLGLCYTFRRPRRSFSKQLQAVLLMFLLTSKQTRPSSVRPVWSRLWLGMLFLPLCLRCT